jgi:hypothetical protein
MRLTIEPEDRDEHDDGPPAKVGDVWILQDEDDSGTPVGESRRIVVEKVRKLANGGWQLVFSQTE